MQAEHSYFCDILFICVVSYIEKINCEAFIVSKDVQPEMCGTKQGNAPKSGANKIFKIYHISAPFEEPNTGDYDYCNKLNELINDYAPEFKKQYGSEIHSQYLKLSDLGVEKEEIDVISALIFNIHKQNQDLKLGLYEKQQASYAAFEELYNNNVRRAIIQKVLIHIQQEMHHVQIISVINLQIRSLDTGFVLAPNDFRVFQENKIKVNITCHEYKLNEERSFFQAILHGYFKEADSVTFFNKSDFNRAKKHADRSAFDFVKIKKTRQDEWVTIQNEQDRKTSSGADRCDQQEQDIPQIFTEWASWFKHPPYNLQDKNVIFTCVPPTVGYTEDVTFEEFQQKKPNIVVFGMIRGNKGFEAALDIAKVLKDKVAKGEITSELKNAQVIIVGNPVASEAGATLLKKYYSPDLVKKHVKRY